jgi:hypothetical protein
MTVSNTRFIARVLIATIFILTVILALRDQIQHVDNPKENMKLSSNSRALNLDKIDDLSLRITLVAY